MRFLIILVFFYTLSCKKNNIETEDYKENNFINLEQVTTISSISNYDSMAYLVKIKGDTIAFNELFYYLKDSHKLDITDTLMYYSKIMADKYENILAHYYYLDAICEKYDVSFKDYNFSKLNISTLKDFQKKEIENWLNRMLQKNIITKEQYYSVKR